jgi:hypothetical protein
VLRFVLVVALSCGFAAAADKADARLREVKKLFVAGNNEAAERIRSEIRKDTDSGKVCFGLATKAVDADATLDVADDSVKDSGNMPGRHDRVTGTLTMKSGDLIWSRTESFSDAPFMSGVKTAAGLVYGRLKKDACR